MELPQMDGILQDFIPDAIPHFSRVAPKGYPLAKGWIVPLLMSMRVATS